MTSRFEVFTPGDFPRHNYVVRKFMDEHSRALRNPEDEIQEALKRPGMIVQISGPSKSGKTVMLQQMLEESRLVRVHGSSIYSEESLWRNVADELQLCIERKTSTKLSTENGRESGLDAGIEAGPFSVGGSLGSSSKLARETEQERTLPGYTLKAIVAAFTEGKFFLFIDDFHTIPATLKRYVASQLKAANERKVKIILAEVSHRADDAIESLQDLAGRIERIEFGPWSSEDLASIGRKGFQKLNLTVNEGTLAALADESCGSPQLMQRLCLNLCQELRVEESLPTPATAGANLMQLRSVLSSAIKSIDYGGTIYALETTVEHNQGGDFISLSGAKLLPSQVALASLALSPPRSYVPFLDGADNLKARAARLVKPQTTEPSRELLAAVYGSMSNISQQPTFKAPALHFTPQSGITILDSLFLYSLRWSSRYCDLRTSVESGPSLSSAATASTGQASLTPGHNGSVTGP